MDSNKWVTGCSRIHVFVLEISVAKLDESTQKLTSVRCQCKNVKKFRSEGFKGYFHQI
jgi:hypothetical protein